MALDVGVQSVAKRLRENGTRIRLVIRYSQADGTEFFTFGSRTVSYNPPRHRGVGFRRDFGTGAS